MTINLEISKGHARALTHNFKSANPSASVQAIGDYVATEMVNFISAHRAQGVDGDYDTWYASTVNSLTN